MAGVSVTWLLLVLSLVAATYVAMPAKGGRRGAKDADDPHNSNVLEHMLHEIKHGHTSQADMTHYKTEIMNAFSHGSISQDDLDKFFEDLKNIEGPHTASISSFLWFG